MKASKWLMQQSNYAKGWLLATVLVAYVANLMVILQAGVLAFVVDAAFIHHRTVADLSIYFVCFFAPIGVRAVCSILREWLSFRAGAAIRHRVRLQLWDRLHQLGPSHLRTLGDAPRLSHHLLEEVEALQAFFAQYLPQMILVLLVPVTILCIVFPMSWVAGIILLVTAPLTPIFMALIGMGAAALNRKNFVALGRMSQHFLDILQGLSTLHLFDAIGRTRAQVSQVSDAYRQTTMSVLKVAFLSSGVLELFASVSIALLATYLGLSFLGYIHFGFSGHHLTLLTGLFILLLAPEFYLPLRELGTHYHARAEAVAAAEEILPILHQALVDPIVSAQARPTTAEPQVFQHIELQKLCYQYPNRQDLALHNIEWTITAGMRVAIVGASGAGKTTLLNVLAGFLLPTAGSVKIDNQTLSACNLTEWREQVTWLGQNPGFFHGSIAENLRLAAPDATDEGLYAALEKAGVAQCVAGLSAGLDTQIASGNTGLSGGKLQRVALARAYLKPAPIVLLDEPTAHLGVAHTHHIMSALMGLGRDKTVIMLTHQLQLLSEFDQIIVLEAGKIVQIGLYQDLCQSTGVFQSLLSEAGQYV